MLRELATVARKKQPRGRGPVVHLDRTRKARMIEAFLVDFLDAAVEGFDLLDIGSGNGDISEYFASKNRVRSVDVVDQRREHGLSDFTLVDSEDLPFADASLDIVLSHHVIEHVGDQSLHLREIRRVLRDDGVAYLATPNRSSPIMEGHVGNEGVLRWREMIPLFEANGFVATDYGWKLVSKPDQFFAEQRFGRFLPRALVHSLRRFYPSHMFVMRPKQTDV